MKLTLPNGIVLDSDGGSANTATQYARQKRFTDLLVVLAVHPNGVQKYLLLQLKDNESIPLYESASLEGVGVHIDMLAACRDMT